MNSLDFIVTLGDETLTMRDATAKCIYQKHGMAVPEILKDVVVTNFLGRLRRAPSARAFGPGFRPPSISYYLCNFCHPALHRSKVVISLSLAQCTRELRARACFCATR